MKLELKEFKNKDKIVQRWMVDGKFTAPENIAEGEKRIYFNQCFLCGNPGMHKRLLNSRQLPLCDEHYFQVTLGRLAQAARELGL